MRISSRCALREFWKKCGNADAEQPLKAWFREASQREWATPAAIKAAYRSGSISANGRVVFNIAGKKYRLVVKVNYKYRVMYIRFVGTHRQGDGIDLTEV